MTLLTAITRPDYSLVAVDSAAFGASGQPIGREITKAVPLAHAKAVLAIQGSADLLVFLSGASRHFADVDEAESIMPRLLQIASQTVPGLAATAANAGSRVSLFGYSQSRGGMVHMTWLSTDGFKTVETEVYTRAGFVTPAGAPAPRVPVKTIDDLERYVTQEQVPYLRKRDATEPIGGDLVLIRLDKHGVRITYGPDLGMPAGSIVREEAVHCTLRETAAAIFDPAASFDVLEVADNTALPDPTDVPQVTGVTFTSGATAQQDMSILVRSVVSWDAVTSQAVRQSGKIEVQWIEASTTLPSSADWPNRTEVDGNATSVVIPSLRAGVHHIFRVRARTTLGVRGKWSLHKLGQVDSAPQVGTDGIESNAATETQIDTNASGQINANSPDYSVVVRTTVNEVTWTNTTAGTVKVQMEHSVYGTWSNTGAGTGDIWFEFEYSVSGGGGAAGVASNLHETPGEFQASNINETAVASGATITVTLKAAVTITSGTQVRNTWRDAVTRVSAIKR